MALIESIIGSEPETFEELARWTEKYDSYSGNIKYKLSAEDNLSNGDTVEVTFSVTGKCADKVASKSKEFVVSNLTEVEIIDVFKDIELIFNGTAGNAAAKVKYNSDSKFLMGCDFSIEPNYSLKNGDTVTVSIENSNELAEKYNAIPLKTSNEYTVSGLESYVTETSQISIDTINELANKFLEQTKSEQTDNFIFTYKNFKYYGSYLFVKKENPYNKNNNQLQIFVSYDKYQDGSLSDTIYLPLIFSNITCNTEGEVSINYDDGYTSVFTTNIEEYLLKSEDDYTISKFE